jgi:WXXGXW repeat (2 copies)
MRNRLIGGILGVLLLAALPAAAFAQVVIGVSVNTAPPPLPVYVQPACPGVGYLWTPGYWAWGDGGYYWVPGTWVMAPQPGLLWTPGWWGWSGGAYVWHAGYWGPQVGFYGGVNYGFGYSGNGYGGGYWRGNQFYYNRSVNNVTNTTNITNIYNSPPPSGGASHVSYNGGHGGLSARPTAQQLAYEHAQHVSPTAAQTRHEQAASRDPQLRASVNHGKPAVAATAKPGEFSGKDVVAAVAAGGAVHAAAASAARSAEARAAQRQHAEEQRTAQAEQRQHAEEQRTAQAEQRQHAAQPPSRIREAQAQPRPRPLAARANAHGGKPPASPKQEEKPRGPGG